MAVTNTDLERLPGVGPATADQLIDAGFVSYRSIAVASPNELSSAIDIGESTAADVITAARAAADIGGFTTGADILRRREELGKLQWRVPAIDAMLNGGIETRSITEVYGGFGTGKSQITHQLAVNVQLPEVHGGLEGSAVLIDTEDTFRPERIDQMVRGLPPDVREATLRQRGIDGPPDDEETLQALVEDVLATIHVAKAFNSDHQMLLTERVRELVSEQEETDWPIRLLCIDSLTAHFRAEYVGRGQLAERQQKLNKHLSDLSRISTLHNVAVFVTNQVQSDPDSFFGDPTRPIGGNVLGHKSTVRLYLRQSKGTKRIVRLVDAPNLPGGEAVMRIEGDGLTPE